MTVGEPFRGLLQAHWYQWDGFYIVLYRGFDASDGTEICAGNSIQSMGSFVNVSNSPHLGATNEICVGVSSLTLPLSLLSSPRVCAGAGDWP